MEILHIENLTFTYNGAKTPALTDVSLTVTEGELVLLCGRSGCGKSTLLRLIKKELSPNGDKSGDIRFLGNSAGDIGFVFQSSFGDRFMYRHSMKAPDEMFRLHEQFYRWLE